MCGRYSLGDKKFVNLKWSGFSLVDVNGVKKVVPNYNVAPTQKMPVVVKTDQGNQLEFMHWGIPRTVAKDTVKEIINTRSDKAFERFWNKTVTHHRCLIPATGFYEWKTEKDCKHPFYIKPKDQDLFAFAGIWSEWTDDEGKKQNSYSILTTEPNKEMRQIHNRMPVILHQDEYEAWLANTDNRDDIEPLLHPYEDNGLIMHEVSRAVNNVRNNSPELLEQIQ